MQISEIRKLAQEKMTLHGIGHWNIVFTEKRSFIGQCARRTYNINPRLSSGEIRLSIPFMEVLSDYEILDTILHEIAHALTIPGVKAHGEEWKAVARRLGARPATKAPADTPAAKARYMGKCPGGHEFSQTRNTEKLHRRTNWCRTCKNRVGGGIITWVDTYTGKVLNPETPTSATAPVRVAARTAPKPVSAPIKRPKVESFKDRFDRGDTSFADVW